MKHPLLVSSLIFIFAACGGQEQTAGSAEEWEIPENEPVQDPWGRNIDFPALSAEDSARLQFNVEEALNNLMADTTEANYIWLGRRLAYMGRYKAAIEVYTHALEKFPESYRLLRHRGHRYISTRQLDKAIADLVKAAELAGGKPVATEPDGIPNRLNQPLSNTHFNIYYHLGLAYYLKGEYRRAMDAYEQCLEYSDNTDLQVATRDWMYMTWRRLGEEDSARKVLSEVDTTLTVIENDAYLIRLLMYRGIIDPEEISAEPGTPDYALTLATQGYGIANFHLANGDTTRAVQLMNEILKGKSKTAFGYIAAEADLHRLGFSPER